MKIKPIQFNFSKAAYERLEELKTQLNVSSKTEVVRLSILVLSWLVKELKAGHKILVVKEPGQAVELNFPYLPIQQQESDSSRESAKESA